MMLKLFGVLLILGSGAFAASLLARYEKRKLAVLAGWADLIWYVRSQVDCYLLPLPQILAQADPDLLKACSCQQSGADLVAVLRASHFYLDAESRRLLSAFVREMGCGSRQEILHRCDYYIASLGKLRTKRMEDLPARLRISFAVCIGSAVLISILLW